MDKLSKKLTAKYRGVLIDNKLVSSNQINAVDLTSFQGCLGLLAKARHYVPSETS